jgi:hypothetical protein
MPTPRVPAHSELDRLCGPENWRVIGVSALVCDQESVYLEVAKPRDWQTGPQGEVLVPLTCIGGHLEPGEELLDCLAREAQEEIGAALQIQGTRETRLIFNDELRPESYTGGTEPLPWFCTVGPNRLPDAADDVPYLVIVTYLAHALQTPTPHDIFGLLAIPHDALRDALPPEPLPWQTVCQGSRARLLLTGELPPAAHLTPTLTARSIRLLLRSGLSPSLSSNSPFEL